MHCNLRNSRLPLPTNSQENSDFLKVVRSLTSGYGDFALDATDKEVEGVWRTLDTQPLNYTNFLKKDNTNTETNYAQFCYTPANCGSHVNGSAGNWLDVEWGRPTEVICEKDAQVTTDDSKEN